MSNDFFLNIFILQEKFIWPKGNTNICVEPIPAYETFIHEFLNNTVSEKTIDFTFNHG